MSKTKNIFKLTLLSILLFGLSACGGGKKVVTSDDSADYKSASSLPPLKKPSAVASATSEPTVEPVPSGEPDELGALEDTVTEQGQSEASSVVAAQEPSIDSTYPQSVVENSDTATSETREAAVEKTEIANVPSARVIAGESDNARLEIGAGFESAWAYLNRNLKLSNVTVFSRNKAAGRFSIGCGDMESVTVTKKGGWSIFNRSKQKRSEYCALSVVERRGKSLVFVLNRDGTEVSREHSSPLFTRILNN